MKLERELHDQVQIKFTYRPKKTDLVELGKDIYVRQLKYTNIAEKHGVSIDTIQAFTTKVKPPQYVHVRVGTHQWKWIKRDTMKIKVELELENKSWTASEIMWGLSKLIETLDQGTNCSGAVHDKKDRVIGRYEIATFTSPTASKEVNATTK